MKLSLIIQGPMISTGRSGLTANIPAPQVTDEDLVEIDCHPIVAKISDNFGHLFAGGIFLATWKGDLKKEISGVVPLEFTNETKEVPKYSKVSNQIVATNNKLKQFYLIQKAIQEIKKIHPDTAAIFKIRTDQYLDLSLVIPFLQKEIEREEPKVLTPLVFTNGQFQDFYFGAKTNIMEDFVDAYLDNYEEYTQSIHRDVPLRCSKLSRYLKVKTPSFFLRTPLFQQYILGVFSERYLEPLPKEVYSNIIWRGEPISSLPNHAFFSGEKITFKKFYFKDLFRSLKELIKKVFNK